MQEPLSATFKGTFKQQFCNWLSSSGFAFQASEDSNGFSTTIQIQKEEQLLIQVVLVNLEAWQQAGSVEHWIETIEKINATRESGARCVIIWEDFWHRREVIVKSRLNAMLGMSQKIAARLTQVRRIDQHLAAPFLEKNHLNGSVSAKTRYGLFLPKRYFRVLNQHFDFDSKADELLVAVATFSAPRVFQRPQGPFRSFEMVRFASLLHTNVSGGLDKLLTAFIRDKNPDDIMTYADLEWSEGAGYAKLGFEKMSQTDPMPFLVRNDKERISHFSSNEIDAVPATLVYNAGSVKFVKTLWKPAYE